MPRDAGRGSRRNGFHLMDAKRSRTLTIDKEMRHFAGAKGPCRELEVCVRRIQATIDQTMARA